MTQRVTDHLDFEGVAEIRNLPAAAADGQPVTFEQLAAAIEGIHTKAPVLVSTQGNINLASPGATIDGETMTEGDRFLARLQDTASQNGLYVYVGASEPAVRAPDANTGSELNNAVVTVTDGTDAGTQWRQETANPEIGVDDIVFGSFGSGVPNASTSVRGAIQLATQEEVNTGTDPDKAVTPATARNAGWAIKKYPTTVGDGSETTFIITHNLNTRDVVVSVVEAAAPYEGVLAGWEATTVNTVTVTFASAPGTNEFRVVVIG